ncbi:hypothetical protein E4U32_007762 [Claviceps aff. humidiphila group G2b]|nr:hypothetical protein E4U32_007762 [Claviceps aff. humidiphila group G2b]
MTVVNKPNFVEKATLVKETAGVKKMPLELTAVVEKPPVEEKPPVVEQTAVVRKMSLENLARV